MRWLSATKFPYSEFRYCRKARSSYNDTVLDTWVKSGPDFNAFTLLKGRLAHAVLLQNGDMQTSVSTRYRTGFWTEGFRHFSSMRMYVDGESAAGRMRKFVRRMHCNYRSYDGAERIDFIPYNEPALWIHLLVERGRSVSLNFEVSHALMWPSQRRDEAAKYTEEGGCILKSGLGSTEVVVPEGATVSFEGGVLSIDGITGAATVVISPDRGALRTDLYENRRLHRSMLDGCILETPDLRMNKAFLWARHDLVEHYTSSETGNGFCAGFPEFSWFFGRDGEWMSMAASMCNLGQLAFDHLSMLLAHSVNGRIPHEIPLLQKEQIEGTDFTTGFMSIDSTPLWIISEYLRSVWTGTPPDTGGMKRCLDFMLSCDRDGDLLPENRFSEGLIGWPESWAKDRDGACIDVCAWWLTALKIWSSMFPEGRQMLARAESRYQSTFFSGDGELTVYDSVSGQVKRVVRNACLIVPAIYMRGGNFRELVLRMSGPDMMTPWGYRSMSSEDGMYDRGYHTGCVWPLMTGWYCLAAYNNGLEDLALEALRTFPMLMYSSPELGKINEVYASEQMLPTGQFAQGWSSSLFIQCVMEGLLGISAIEYGADAIYRATPRLPPGWNEVRIRKLQYGGKLWDLQVTRNGIRVREHRMAKKLHHRSQGQTLHALKQPRLSVRKR